MRIKSLGSKIYLFLSALLILLVGGGIAMAIQNNMHKLPLRQYFSNEQTNAVWDWRNPTTYSQTELEEVADFLFIHQINTIYSDISIYADIQFSDVDDSEKTFRMEELEKSINNYISAMDKKGIRVFASSGNTDWSKPANWDKPLNIQSFVHDYNNNNDMKFSGIEFDIESYNQLGFANASFTEKELVLLEFLDLSNEIANRHTEYVQSSNQDDFELGFAIPYWFDNANQNIRSVTWYDKTGPVLFHLLDRLNEVNKSNVVVMAYRDAALGNDGMIYHSRTEIDYAQSRAPNVAIIIGVEVTEVEPEKITFFGKTMTELSNEFKLVEEEFRLSGVLGGVAINDLEGLRELD
jgi:hypothetical protein